jgi:UDP-N-acetylmuramate--alanine ligase
MKHVHLIGIGGSGLSAIARLLMESGIQVSGSDRVLSPLARDLANAGATVYTGHAAENIAGADLVIRSSAVTEDNPEVVAAQAAGIPVMKRHELLGEIMASHFGIAVAGTHGKTTTTAMTAWVLTALEQDPSFIIGGVSKNLGTNAHAGKGRAFVLEADEYDRTFLALRPDLSIVTMVEHDHPDCYPTPEEYREAFVEFVQRLKPGGTLLVCKDDPEAASLQAATAETVHTFTYGLDPQSDYYAANLKPGLLGYRFDVIWQSKSLVSIELSVPGEHNVRNALAAFAAAHQLGLNVQAAAKALSEFCGTGRRFDVQGEVRGVVVVDDYAHHPTEIKTTLAAARSRYPGRRIWAVWQPHTFSRTQALLSAFLGAFQNADRVIVTEIYAAREKKQAFSGADIVRQMDSTRTVFAPTLENATQHLIKHLHPGDVLLVLSAGDADQISAQVLEILKRKESHRKPRLEELRAEFDNRLQENVLLSNYTTAHVGGPVDGLLVANSAADLEAFATKLWKLAIPFKVIGSGSNLLVSDSGYEGVVIINRARAIKVDVKGETPFVSAESGASLGGLARQVALRGLSGLEWASTIPGTVGGAVYGNAGAHGGDVSSSLLLADILHPNRGKESWSAQQMDYEYRSSRLKRNPDGALILGAKFKLLSSTPTDVQVRMAEFSARRRNTQPPGASLGSMFRNPPGDYAGRLIEAAGLKGKRIGGAEISSIHANFFINDESASADDIYQLIQLARKKVMNAFGIQLELEIELLGDWPETEAMPDQDN